MILIDKNLSNVLQHTVTGFSYLYTMCVTQMDQAKQELSRKDSELLGLRTKLDTLNNQFSDSKQHVDVLKESLTAKEQRAAILQTEVKPWCCLFPLIFDL